MTKNHLSWSQVVEENQLEEACDGEGRSSQTSPLVLLHPLHFPLLQFPCSNSLICCDVQSYDSYQSRAPCLNTVIWIVIGVGERVWDSQMCHRLDTQHVYCVPLPDTVTP